MRASAPRKDPAQGNFPTIGLPNSYSGIILSYVLLGIPVVLITATVLSIALLLTIELLRRRSERLRGGKAR